MTGGQAERVNGELVTGNYFTGPSVGACVAEATETAARAHQFLSESKDSADYRLRWDARA